MSIPMHPKLRLSGDLSWAMFAAAEAGFRRTQRRLRRPQRDRIGRARKPGFETPYWNLLSAALRRALREHGAKAKLARYLGVPRQRITEFVSSKRRLPDAELTLRLLHWLNDRRISV
jgi:hypothetical protein